MIEKRIECGFRLNWALTPNGVEKFASLNTEIYVPEEIEKFIRTLVPDARFTYMHVIAMSDGDSYGPNMNGDVFSWDELVGLQDEDEAEKNPGDMKGVRIPRYKTFEQAKFFKHHANSAYDDAYGDVVCAAKNDPMRRIELIIRVAKHDIPELNFKGFPEVCEQLDRGDVIPVSMGTRIAYEKCSYCGAENEAVWQRCPHLANMMNEIMPNGIRVCALNFKPRFFDISKVTIPADPIAFSLAKVASRLVSTPRTNSARDVRDGVSLWRVKWSEITKEIPSDAVEKVDPESAGIEFSDIEPGHVESLDGDVDKAAQLCGDLNTVLSQATRLGIVLSPIEFAKTAHLCGVECLEDLPVLDVSGLFSQKIAGTLYSSLAARSAYYAVPFRGAWLAELDKIASIGADLRDAYVYYRTKLRCLPYSVVNRDLEVLRAKAAEWSIPQPSRSALSAAVFLTHAGL